MTLKSRRASAETQRVGLAAYVERGSLRGLERIFGSSRQTICPWIKYHVTALPTIRSTLLPARADDILELDEA